MASFLYTGEPGRVWPALPVTPDVGDVVDWGQTVPDPNCWAPTCKAATRPPDNADEDPPADLPVDLPDGELEPDLPTDDEPAETDTDTEPQE